MVAPWARLFPKRRIRDGTFPFGRIVVAKSLSTSLLRASARTGRVSELVVGAVAPDLKPVPQRVGG